VYENLPGDILEGGQSFNEMISQLEKIEGPTCVNIIEMALSIELAAFDLYRNVAHQFPDTEIKKPFLAIAQVEKEHMQIAAKCLRNCQL
jgi:rubrerythrin